MFMPSFFIKLIELGIATACLILQQYSYDLTDVPTLILCSGTYVGFILVLTGELIGEMVFAPLDIIQDVYFSVLGMAMFGTCGWLLYTARSDSERSPRTDDLYASYTAGLATVNVVVMLCEMLSGKQDPFIEAWWSSAGAMLYGSCAARTLQGWRYVPDCPRRGLARACAICAFAATSIFIIDAIRVLCEDDSSSIISSHHKLTKARAPSFGLEFASESPKCISKPVYMHKNPIRLFPFKVPTNDLPISNGVNVNFHLNNAPMAGDAPKMYQKLTPTKIPAPLRMGPKVMRTFW